MSDSGEATDAFDARVEGDAGDTTQRNFAFQHGYGAFLLISALRDGPSYEAVWCEHHEDLVGEYGDGDLDAYQVKTRTREDGPWKNTDEPFVKALGTLTRARVALGARLRGLFFVSNVPVMKTLSKQESEKKKSPIVLATKAASCGALADLEPYLQRIVRTMASATSHSADAIFETLRRVVFHAVWDRDSTDAQLATHLGYLPELRMAGTPEVLRRLTSVIVGRIHAASSLQCADPAKFYGPLRPSATPDPLLMAKRVSLIEIQGIINEAQGGDFRYPDSPAEFPAFVEAVRGSGGSRLRKKMTLARIPGPMIETAEARANATVGRLLERQARDETSALDLLRQLREYVSAAYGESMTAALASGTELEAAGPKLMAEMESRLRELEARKLRPLGGEPYETLSGVAALLTDECKFWWGPEQDLETPHDD